MIGKLLMQIASLLFVAVFFGLCLKQLNVSMLYSIPLGIGIQFGLYYAFITVLNTWVALKNKKLENERIKEFSLQGMEVTCPCPQKRVDFVPITLNTTNTYKCGKCQKGISVYVVPETALMTETIPSPQLPSIPSIATE